MLSKLSNVFRLCVILLPVASVEAQSIGDSFPSSFEALNQPEVFDPAPAVVPATFSAPVAETDTSPGGCPATRESIAAELASIEAAVSVPEEVRKDCAERLRKAQEWLDSKDVSAKRQLEIETYLKTVPKLLAEAQSALAKPAETESSVMFDGAKIADLESQLINLRRLVETSETNVSTKSAEVESRTTRLAELAKEAVDLEKRILDASTLLAALNPDDFASQAQALEQRSRLACRQQQLTTAKLERQRLEETGALLTMQLDVANRELNANKKQLSKWQATIDAWRKEESQRQANEARRIANESHPALKSLAEQNAQIAETRIATAAMIEKTSKAIGDLNGNIKSHEEDFEDLRSKVEHAGATSSTGLLLRKKRSELPKPSEFAERIKYVQTEMPRMHLQLTEWKQLRRQVADPDEATLGVMKSLEESLAKYDREQVVEVVGKLLRDRRELLDAAIADQETLLRKLNELELVNQKHDIQISEFREFLNQRVLWIRSADPIDLKDLRSASTGFLWIVKPERWKEVASVAAGDVLKRPVIAISLIAGFILLLVFRARLMKIQAKLCSPPEAGQPAIFSRFASAVGLALLLSARWPVLLLAIGYRLRIAAESTAWTQAVGDACINTVLFLWACELVRELCRRNGVGEQVFGWSPAALKKVRGSLEFTAVAGTPLFALLQLSQFGDLPELRSLQRALFIAIMAMFTIQIGWRVRPGGPLMQSLKKEGRSSIVSRFRHPIWIAAFGAPLALSVLSVIGYHFSAYHLSGRMAETGIAIYAIIVLHSLALCWLDVKGYNRKLDATSGVEGSSSNDSAISIAQIGGTQIGGTQIGGSQIESVNLETDTPDVAITPVQQKTDATDEVDLHDSADSEFRDLLRWASVVLLICGGWFIWSDVLPALRILDQVELWQNVEMVAEKMNDGQGKESITMTERNVPTTLTDLCGAILVGIATLMIGRRLPSALELMLLERLPMEPGTRRAVAILVRYTATLAGLLFACYMIRLSWSSVQWLAAAMTVGLGFGMQEIFANLVSGIILLFERPIRMGDLVTVGDVTGNVSRMQIRATTITDFDRRELIVPNKKFITDNVINWTLTDPVSRVSLPVGVAYGTDVQQVHDILEMIAVRSPYVMEQPAPSTLFKGFGDSTLNMELRVFIATRDQYPLVVNELNAAIASEFAKSNIEIAFPQRDLHVKSIESLQALIPQRRERKAS